MMDEDDFECVAVLQHHSQDVKMVLFLNETCLASCSYDDTIHIYKVSIFHIKQVELDDWVLDCTLVGHTSTVWSIDVNASGNQLVSVSDDESLRIWQDNQGSWESIFVSEQHHKGVIYSVSWSKIHHHIASCGADSIIKIGLFDNGWQSLVSIQAHTHYEINCVKWCPLQDHSTYLASAGDDALVNVWEFDQEEESSSNI